MPLVAIGVLVTKTVSGGHGCNWNHISDHITNGLV